jgi:hypothetical protein
MDLLLAFISTLGLVLAVGSSTYAITFFEQSLLDGRIDKTEKRFLHTVYFVLRLGMVLLTLSVVWRMFLLAQSGMPLFSDQTLWFQFALLIIVNINAVLMDQRLIPMWLGPALAGGSWYGYFLSVILAPLSLAFFSLLLYWLCLVIAFILLRRVLHEWVTTRSGPRA